MTGNGDSVFEPGQTCWRVEPAARAAVLIDNEAFYAALLRTLEAARRSIFILGWAFDPRTRLKPDGTDGPADPDEVGRILSEFSKRRPELDIRLLIWKSAFAANGSYDFIGHRAAPWFARSRIRFRLDDASALGACHHQKVIVVDDRVAFCGGGDIVPNRWDTPDHLADDPRRVLPEHAPYPPRHEVTMMVEGAIASALGDLFRERWREAGEDDTRDTGEDSALAAHAAWPRTVERQFRNLPVAIARTKAEPHQPVAQEILNLTLACIRAATRTIYLENQYFTSQLVAQALAERLVEPAGPQIVLILGDQSPSWFDRFTMDYARNPIIRRLQALDLHGRLRVYTARTARGGPIRVHSKVSIFDDAIVRVGSANLNHRSGGFDSECELAIEACTAAQRRSVSALRDRLIGHFLGVAEEAFAKASREIGLGEAIDALNDAGRLAPLRPRAHGPWETFVSRYRVGDPTSLDDNWRLLRRRVQAQAGNL